MKYIKEKQKETLEYLTSQTFIYSVLGIILLLAIWQVGAVFMHEIIIASPLQTFNALFNMFGSERFWSATFITSQRAVAGILLGGFAGFVLGIFAGLNENIKNLFEPMRWMVMSISPVIVVVIAMLWFGM